MPNNSAEKFYGTNKPYQSEVIGSNHVMTDSGFVRLKTYLGNVRKGQSKIFTAPFAKGESTQKILKDWDKTLVSIKDKWPSLYEFEKDLAKKVGPLSVQKPLSERMTDIEHYYEDILLSSKTISDTALTSVLEEFSSLRGMRLRSQESTVEKMKKSTSSGTPFMMKRREAVDKTLPVGIAIERHNVFHVDTLDVKEDTKDGVFYVPAIVGWRGQEGGPTEDDVKQRVIWMFPFGVNIVELQVYQPLIELAQQYSLVPAWISMESVDDRITKLFDTKGNDDLIVCTDFSRFDQHFNPVMQEAAKTILNGLLARGDVSNRWLEKVFPIKYWIPLIYDNGNDSITWMTGRHGMASGSGGTNCDETLVHRALQYEVAESHNAKLNPNSQCLGDDGILSYPGITVEDVVASYSSHGQECNPDKQYASTQDCVYLRRWHHRDYRIDGRCAGVYSTFRAIGRLRYLERFMDPEYWSPELVALRQLSIIENCKYHPLRDEFAQFCMERDKYRLGIDIPGFLDNITQLATEAVDHMQDFLGYTKTLQGEGPDGINEWWIVKYLKSHR